MSKERLLANSRIGLVPLNWDFSDSRKEEVVAKIREYGFLGIQISEKHANSQDYLQLFKRNALSAAELYIAIKCTPDSIAPNSDEESKRQIDAAKSGGVEMIVFAVDGTAERDRVAANAQMGPALSEKGMRALAEHLNKWGKYCHSLGIKYSFHQHAATFIETPEEMRRLFDLLDTNMGLCLDVGHWIVGGGDPIKAVGEYGQRITHLHVKDVDGLVLAKLRQSAYEGMKVAVMEHKLFTPAGTGVLDLKGLFKALDEIRYEGWLMSEQDSAWEPTEEKSLESYTNIVKALTS